MTRILLCCSDYDLGNEPIVPAWLKRCGLNASDLWDPELWEPTGHKMTKQEYVQFSLCCSHVGIVCKLFVGICSNLACR